MNVQVVSDATPIIATRWSLEKQLAYLVPALAGWWLVYANLARAASWFTLRASLSG